MLARLRRAIAAHPLFYAAVALLWVKTYIVQRFYFELPIQNVFQELVLWLNPLSSALFMLLIAMVFANKHNRIGMIVVSLISSAILFANVLYYRFYNDFVTLPLLWQKSNVGGGMKSSTVDLMSPWDAFIFVDVLILIYLAYFRKMPAPTMTRRYKSGLALTMVIVFLVNLGAAELLRPQLLSRSFDRQIIVRSIGTFNYHVYDIVINSQMKSKKVFADTKDFEEVKQYLLEKHRNEQLSDQFGAAKGRNVFLISMESLQAFTIDAEYNGTPLTPFLNRLVDDSSTFYFTNFYHQTGQGKTSDAEFMMDNSLYPLPSGAVYFTHAQNTFNATPSILKNHGYYSAAFHANDGSFWNRDLMYKNLGYDHYYDKEYYEIKEDNSVGWGLKDVEFFEQSMPYVEELPQPFYAKFLTLTNHHPFVLDEESQMMVEAEEDGESEDIENYFNTVHYMDGALEKFFDEVKKAGLYENSIFVMYGDHYGVTPGSYEELGDFLGYEIGTYEHMKLQRTPLIIHAPGLEGRVIDDLAGQVDVKPTVLHLLGVKDGDAYNFGRDLLAPAKDPIVILRDGSFITDDYVFTADTCYANPSGEIVDTSVCKEFQEEVDRTLNMSDDIIYGDLFRFIMNDKKKQ